eukprot:XP_027314824.1 olfactory receptor-like protein COR4 isoform X2 [Anas platyrhynchos]
MTRFGLRPSPEPPGGSQPPNPRVTWWWGCSLMVVRYPAALQSLGQACLCVHPRAPRQGSRRRHLRNVLSPNRAHWGEGVLPGRSLPVAEEAASREVTIVLHTEAVCRANGRISRVIDHFFCDISPLISLSTSDTTLNQIMLRTLASLFGVSSGLVVLLSYIAIISTILSIRSAKGKCKAFSTCASHLAVVSIFYGTAIFMYLKASSRDDKRAAVLYTVVTPMLNPLIYSLRNQEVKEALRRLTKMRRSCMLYMYG